MTLALTWAVGAPVASKTLRTRSRPSRTLPSLRHSVAGAGAAAAGGGAALAGAGAAG